MKDSNTQNYRFLTVKNPSVRFDTEEGWWIAADQVDFQIMKGENVGLVGESGCGKSVTALAILRSIPRHWDGLKQKNTFSGRHPFPECQTDAGYSGQCHQHDFQEPSAALSPLHRIGRQTSLTLHRKNAGKGGLGICRTTGWPKWAFPTLRSGCTRIRFSFRRDAAAIMIAMALMLSPKLTIADEPTTALM
ncbi:MAG: ATP-binding cassette domain-containing protein [Desulfobacterales bacterium]